jgi:hypothetical protein
MAVPDTLSRPIPAWIVFCCAAVLAAQIADATTFSVFYMLPNAASVGAEQNPVIRALVDIGGPALVTAVKLAFGYGIWRSARRFADREGQFGRAQRVALPIVAAVTLIGAAFNTRAIFVALGA